LQDILELVLGSQLFTMRLFIFHFFISNLTIMFLIGRIPRQKLYIVNYMKSI
jgi:hypothetical protein